MKKLICFLCAALFFTACTIQVDPPQNKTKKVVVVEDPQPSVCVIDGLSVRSAPTQEGELLTTLMLGEKITWMGVSEADSTSENLIYLKVKTSDGTEGWSAQFGIATDAEPSVTIKRTTVFKRPDLLTMTDLNIEPMELLAIVDADSGWIQVVGEKGRKLGWVKTNAVSLRPEDVAVGLLAKKALAEKDNEKLAEKLEPIIENNAFASSVFMDELHDIYRDVKRWRRDREDRD